MVTALTDSVGEKKTPLPSITEGQGFYFAVNEVTLVVPFADEPR
jgi:hypothetical protein